MTSTTGGADGGGGAFDCLQANTSTMTEQPRRQRQRSLTTCVEGGERVVHYVGERPAPLHLRHASTLSSSERESCVALCAWASMFRAMNSIVDWTNGVSRGRRPSRAGTPRPLGPDALSWHRGLRPGFGSDGDHMQPRSRVTICSGGQSGVDRAALDVAIELGLLYVGWCPRGGWAEDLVTPPGVRAKFPMLKETPSADPRQRTAWNVRDSDVTLLLEDDSNSAGSEFTRICAELIFQRLAFVVRIGTPSTIDDARQWLDAAAKLRGESLIVNVAGPRESEAPGIGERASHTLREILEVFSPSSGRGEPSSRSGVDHGR